MLVRMGTWFKFEVSGGGVYLEAPVIGSVWIGFDGEWHWD